MDKFTRENRNNDVGIETGDKTIARFGHLNKMIDELGGPVGGFERYIGEEYLGGIVFHLFKDFDGLEHGLIVSKTHDTSVWQDVSVTTGANRTEDGSYNTPLITNSTLMQDFLVDLENNFGGDWYLPSIDELSLLSSNRFAVQKTLRSTISTLLSGKHWSSTEFNTTLAFIFDFNGGFVSTTVKSNPGSVRGVRSF